MSTIKKTKSFMTTVYISRKTNRPVSEAWAIRNPDKVIKNEVSTAALEAAKKAKVGKNPLKKTPLQKARVVLKKAQAKARMANKALKKAIAAEKAGARKAKSKKRSVVVKSSARKPAKK